MLAQRGQQPGQTALRERLDRPSLGPGAGLHAGERSGELVNAAVEGVEALDDYLTQFLPARLPGRTRARPGLPGGPGPRSMDDAGAAWWPGRSWSCCWR